jgi:hypothetical protein
MTDLNEAEVIFVMSMFALARPHIPKEDSERVDNVMNQILDKLASKLDKTPLLDGILIGLKMNESEKETKK